MVVIRLLRLCLHLAAGLWTSALIFPFLDDAARQRRIKRWSSGLLALCGVTLKVAPGPAPDAATHALIVANHISWLDIFVIDAMLPCRFVAKSDIRDWPVIGWLSARVGTIFIARGNLRDVRRIFKGLVECLHAGEHVAFFPEGTTASQGKLLPFHPNLFEAALDAKVPVQPLALRYVDRHGKFHPAADFVGETTLMQSVFAILKADGMVAELIPLPRMDTAGAHRRELAVAARGAIVSALGLRDA
jgi:1-acyl-sn-glycerol-3-phosphate acyltransferase